MPALQDLMEGNIVVPPNLYNALTSPRTAVLQRLIEGARDMFYPPAPVAPGLRREDFTDIPGDAQPNDPAYAWGADMGMNMVGAPVLTTTPATLGSGAVRGKLGGMSTGRPKFTDDNFNIYVKVDPTMPTWRVTTPTYSIGPDGALEMHVSPNWIDKHGHSAWRDEIFRFLDSTTKHKYDHYWRFTNNPEEIALLKQGQLRPSFNYADRISEPGLSVASDPHYAIHPYKYGYGIKGEKIGVGSDGEPLLNPKTVEAVTDLFKKQQIVNRDRKLAEEAMKKHGWSLKEMSRFLKSRLNFIREDAPSPFHDANSASAGIGPAGGTALGSGGDKRTAGLIAGARVVSSPAMQDAVLRNEWARHGLDLDYDHLPHKIWTQEIKDWNTANPAQQIDPNRYRFGSVPEFEQAFEAKHLTGKKAPYPGAKKANMFFEDQGQPELGAYLSAKDAPEGMK